MSPSYPSGQSEKNRPTGLLGRLRDKLAATQRSFTRGLSDLLLGDRALDDSLFEDLETLLLSADVGVETTQQLMQDITDQVSRQQLNDTRAVHGALRQGILSILEPCHRRLEIAAERPFIIMVVGVNGVGKTTTIAKLANYFKNQGLTVTLAAADTFRAAAIEQLKTWAGRLDIPVIAQHTGADAAAVVHDALNAAVARHSDVLIVDTAGRQHTQEGLMDELRKIRRVIGKTRPDAPHEVLLVLDAGTGQNALSQLKHFREAVGVTGLALTKLDGTAKGGILIAMARQTGLPIRFIGVGEGMDDLREFNAEEYVDALLPKTE
ncbi:MAG: signal recognition particle-docking protein FtsY [Sulfuricaulis sp.]|uniref:signal recognition particle-docking protein FtsY n=1 Tax=Sulfuricaulis sp. TaxID=2003553 RepID=UPI0025EDBC2D|nr:signal recognition particle-docking protein FtsY [Sulfuricaulis sp.]MCR4346910.1 signal recognition particle-docking protein FtsY [Sulfuricaulis sp.]